MADFNKKLIAIAKDVDFYLSNFFSKQGNNSYLIKPIKYGIFSGGKKFRASVVVNTGKIFGINYKNLIAVAAAVECIHSYSLIHDDLPCMDNDDLRRGKPSTHKKFGESTAVLAGNSLLTMAFEILSDKDLKLSQDIKLDLIHSLSKSSGHSGIAGGQYLDLSFENFNTTKKQVINMQTKKTGKLFAFCCESAAIIAQRNKIKRKQLNTIGQKMGLLFQITDDLIDFTGDSKITGKTTQKDQKQGKATLISLLGYDETLNFVKKLKKELSANIKKYGTKANNLLESVKFIVNRKF